MKPGTILLVDDDLLVLRALRRDLEVTGHRVLTAGSVASAMEALDMEKIDVVISDYQMPGPNGLDLLAHISREHPQIVRMMLTGHAGLDMALAAINAGHVYHLLTKPWSKDELVAAAERCFEVARSAEAAVKDLTVGEEAAPLKRRAVIGELELQYPGISQVQRHGGAICLDESEDEELESVDLEKLAAASQ